MYSIRKICTNWKRYAFLLHAPDGVDVHQGCRDSKETAIETVKETAMAGEHVTTVLDAKLTFDLALHKVTPCAEDGNNKTKAHPLNESERGFVARNYRSYRHGKQSTANAAYP